MVLPEDGLIHSISPTSSYIGPAQEGSHSRLWTSLCVSIGRDNFRLWLTRNIYAIAEILAKQLCGNRNLDRDEEERKSCLRVLESVPDLDSAVDETLSTWCTAMCKVKFLRRKARPAPPVQDDEIEEALAIFEEHNWQGFTQAEEATERDLSTIFTDNDGSDDQGSVKLSDARSQLDSGEFSHRHPEGTVRDSEHLMDRPSTTQAS